MEPVADVVAWNAERRPRSCPLAALCIAAGAFIAFGAGCSSGQPTPPPAGPTDAAAPGDPVGAVPDDLTIDVTILPGRDFSVPAEPGDEGPIDPRLRPVETQRSRYLLFPNGSLHGDVGTSLTVLTRPGTVRTLTREQCADLWLVARQTGFAGGGTGFEGNPAFLQPAPNQLLTIILVQANGQFTQYVVRSEVGQVDPASTRLVRSLARLAWSSDELPIESAVLPIRYDLGPDPYDRFRGRELP